MRVAQLLAGALACIVFAASPVQAQRYDVTVTRSDSDFYRIDGTQIYLKTKYCYEYSFGAEAIVDLDRMQVIFLGYGTSTTCQLEMVFERTR